MKNDWLKKTVEANARHIEIINTELDIVKEHLTTVKSDVDWIKKFLWPILAGVLALVFKVYFV